MAFQFPANPTTGDIFTAAPGVQYRWTGVAWCPFATQFPGVPIFQNPALFADGTQSLPGIAWANEPSMGIARTGPGEMHAIAGGTLIVGFRKTSFTVGPQLVAYGPATFNDTTTVNAGLYIHDIYMGRNKTLYARNMGDTAYWPLIHAGGDDCIHIGWNGYPTTYIYGGGGIKLSVHGGGVDFSGTLSGGQINAQLNGMAALVGNGGYNTGHYFRFHWQDVGAMNYYWGSNDGWNMYISHRDSMRVGVANNADRVGNNYFHWGNWDDNPTWLWGNNNDSNTFLVRRSNMSVNYANRADRVNSIDQASGGTINNDIYYYVHFCRGNVSTQFQSNDYYLNFAIGNPSWAWAYCRIRHAPGSWAGVDWDLAGSYYELRAGGSATKGYGGQWDGQSDIRLKHNVRSLAYGLNEIVKINPIEFELEFPNMETFPKRDIVGVSAQDVEPVMPKMVYREPHEKLGEVLCIRPDYIQYALVNAVKELAARVEQLEKPA